MRNKYISRPAFLPGLLIILSFTSCLTPRQVVYFSDLGDGTFPSKFQDYEPVIQSNDILSIYVSSMSPDATVIFNAPNFATTGMTVSAEPTGYLVDEEGNIHFPVIGNIPAKGLTKKQLTLNITKELQDRKLLVDPIVSIRFLNYRVTVLGEVKNPSVVIVPNEKVSLLEAIGLAGDLTINARRDNVLIIREIGGKRIAKRIDLTSQEILTSPYYYLQSNDLVYVEPNRAKVANSGSAPVYLPIIISTLSLIVITASYFRYR